MSLLSVSPWPSEYNQLVHGLNKPEVIMHKRCQHSNLEDVISGAPFEIILLFYSRKISMQIMDLDIY